jgi:hypothetical protein
MGIKRKIKHAITRKHEGSKGGCKDHTVVIYKDWKIDYETWEDTGIPFYTNDLETRCYFIHNNGAEDRLILEMQVTATDKTCNKWYYHIRVEADWVGGIFGEYDSANEGKFYSTAEEAMKAAEKRGEKLDFLRRDKIKETLKQNKKELVTFYCLKK